MATANSHVRLFLERERRARLRHRSRVVLSCSSAGSCGGSNSLPDVVPAMQPGAGMHGRLSNSKSADARRALPYQQGHSLLRLVHQV